MVEFLIKEGIESNKIRELLTDCLSGAVEMGNKDVVEFLIEKGVDVNRPMGFGNPEVNYIEIFELLIKNGFDVNVHNTLHLAFRRQAIDEAKLLIKNGSDLH